MLYLVYSDNQCYISFTFTFFIHYIIHNINNFKKRMLTKKYIQAFKSGHSFVNHYFILSSCYCILFYCFKLSSLETLYVCISLETTLDLPYCCCLFSYCVTLCLVYCVNAIIRLSN